LEVHLKKFVELFVHLHNLLSVSQLAVLQEPPPPGLERLLLVMGLRLLQEELRLQEPLVQARVQEQRQGGQWVER